MNLPQARQRGFDYADVKGQDTAKKAIEIAAAGCHNILLIGPPGSGKSMLASRIPSILPPLTIAEAIETTKIHSVAGVLKPGVSLISLRPFRSPHHTMSPASLAGGGKNPKPGEISPPTTGCFSLTSFPEFDGHHPVLRQPQRRVIHITKVNRTVTYPNLILVCAMNPCRCGWFGHPVRKCTCTASVSLCFKISPLLDRIDTTVPPQLCRTFYPLPKAQRNEKG